MTNAFHTFWAAGYKRLVPITVAGGPIHPEGSFRDRPKAMGKAPGILRDGKWIGLNWLKLEATEASLEYWAKMGAGVGIRTGAGLIAVDVDTLNDALATKVYKLACSMLGVAPVRFGHRPKHLLLYRVTEDMPYQAVLFDDGLEHKRGADARVELLTEGRQFVAYGIHPVTGKPYTWPKNLPSIDLLPAKQKAHDDRRSGFRSTLRRHPCRSALALSDMERGQRREVSPPPLQAARAG